MTAALSGMFTSTRAAEPATSNSLPEPATFADGIRTNRISFDRFDFAAAGYWDRRPDERLLWFAELQQHLTLATQNITTCDIADRRRYTDTFWLMQLIQSPDAATWSARTGAARARLASTDAELAALRPAPAARDWRVRELQRRYLIDQAIRDPSRLARWRSGLPAGTEMLWDALEHTRSIAVDCDNTGWLRAQMRVIGWFDMLAYGAEADSNAFYLIQHADRTPEFQREVLATLIRLPPEKTSRRNIAFLTDRVARQTGAPQRYGSQGFCTPEGVWTPNEIEDEAHVDERRRAMGLEPMTERIAEMSHACAPQPGT